MYSFNELQKLSKKQASAVSGKIKLAVLADSASQFLCVAVKGIGVAHHSAYDIWEADYSQIDHEVFDENSKLYSSTHDYVLILRSSEHLLNTFYKTELSARSSFAETQIEYLKSLLKQITSASKSKIILNTYFEINDAVFGNYSNKVKSSFLYQLRLLNVALMKLAEENKNLFLLDIASIVSQRGYASSFDSKLYIGSDIAYSLDVLPTIAQNIHSIIQSVNGQFKKCVILDLDNTMWGGIIGDDGMNGIQIGDLGIGKAFTEWQRWIKELKQRGIILAVCSKNTEHIAKEPFESHPDMELRLEDISMFVANWENKVDNIRYIQSVLNIGFDSMVFLDDNPFEREMVKSGIPELTVPDLPEDPAEYLNYMRAQNLFETASFTEEDTERTKLYQEEAKRTIFQKSFANEAEFLQSLDMKSEVAAFNSFTIPRAAQLTQRSNQFNLRTKRYTEAQVSEMVNSPDYFTLSFTLEDKFGNHGLIAIIVLKKENSDTLFIDTWIMSCRVLKRGMEQFTLQAIVELAKQNGFSYLKGEYLPTPKNGMVKNHYNDLGFTNDGDKWILNLNKTTKTNLAFISKK